MSESAATPSTNQDDYDATLHQLSTALLAASAAGNVDDVKTLLEGGASDILGASKDDTGATPLHLAAKNGHLDVVQLLLEHGHPWNVVDNEYRTAGEYAQDAKHDDIYEMILSEGCRAELILSLLGGCDDEDSMDVDESVPNADYLSKPLRYSEDGQVLYDAENNGVMMSWEGPLMVKHAEILLPTEGLSVLNVGFGLGLVDEALQKRKPARHTIVEAHPDVYAHMLKLGWDKRPGVKIIFGRWQDVIDQLETYDAIYWDTFGEDYKHQKEFHEVIPNILNTKGIFSFFNGLAGTNPFFHDVYCRIVEMEMADMGLNVQYVQMDMDPSEAKVWDGIKRRYWSLKKYNLPIIKFASEL